MQSGQALQLQGQECHLALSDIPHAFMQHVHTSATKIVAMYGAGLVSYLAAFFAGGERSLVRD